MVDYYWIVYIFGILSVFGVYYGYRIVKTFRIYVYEKGW